MGLRWSRTIPGLPSNGAIKHCEKANPTLPQPYHHGHSLFKTGREQQAGSPELLHRASEVRHYIELSKPQHLPRAWRARRTWSVIVQDRCGFSLLKGPGGYPTSDVCCSAHDKLGIRACNHTTRDSLQADANPVMSSSFFHKYWVLAPLSAVLPESFNKTLPSPLTTLVILILTGFASFGCLSFANSAGRNTQTILGRSVPSLIVNEIWSILAISVRNLNLRLSGPLRKLPVTSASHSRCEDKGRWRQE